MNLSSQLMNGLNSGVEKRNIPLIYGGAIILSLMLLLMTQTSWAQETTYKEAIPVAEDPEIEKRMLALTEDLRCLVCQNESIAESRADFSNDIRRIIRTQIKDDKTDAEIIDFLVERYGDFVLYNPPMKGTTVLLWFGPLILFMISTWFLIKYLKGRRLQVKEVSLSAEDQKKIAALLNEKEMAQSDAKQDKTIIKETSCEKHQSTTDVSTSENKGNNV